MFRHIGFGGDIVEEDRLMSKEELEMYRNRDLSEEEIATLLAQYHVLQIYRKLIDENLKLIRDILVEQIPDGSFIYGDWRVTKMTYKTKRLDTNALKEHLGDNYNNFLNEVDTVRISVKRED